MHQLVYHDRKSPEGAVELWGQRETLHVYAVRDWSWLVGAMSHDPDTRWHHRRVIRKEGDLATFLECCETVTQV